MFMRVAAAVAACISCSIACADQADQSDSTSDFDTVVVTASRVAQPVSDVIGSVTVIDRDDIKQRQAQSLQDLLRGEAGIDIYNNGGPGKASGMYMRGANTDQTLILVDGQRLGSATDGTTAIQFIPVDQIERIEIVRGSRSSLYGSDAIGGVIQIFTRKSNGVNAAAGYGYHDTQNYSAGAGYKQNGWQFNVNGNYLQSNGINSCAGSPLIFSAGCGTNEPDDDGYRNLSGTLNFGYVNDDTDVEFNSLYARGFTAYDGTFVNETRFTESTSGMKLQTRMAGNVGAVLSAGVTQDRQSDYENSVYMSRFNTNKQQASLQSNWQIDSSQSLTAGIDYLKDTIDSDTQYTATSRRNTGEFAEYMLKQDSAELNASVRNDDNEQFGSNRTGSLGLKWWTRNKDLSFNAGWSKAFHAPSFNDLYYPGYSNPDLLPEISRSTELGISATSASLTWSLQAYETNVDHLIALNNQYLPFNIGQARLRGIEFTLNKTWKQWNTAITYTLQDPRSRASDDNFNHILPRRTRQAGRFNLGYTSGKLQIFGMLNIIGPRFDDLANSYRLGGYTTLDINASWNFTKTFSAQLKFGNVFNRQYESAALFNQPGRNVYFTVSYHHH
ncbi:MAG TPA: TonB-dependent receptor [Steroidobacteraceae bacterium]|nr:TonB-dependent receptor [Steroidobacteraceae bacterium]